MSKRDLRRRNNTPAAAHKGRSTSSRRLTIPSPSPAGGKLKFRKSSRNGIISKVLKRSKSEPLLWKSEAEVEEEEDEEEENGILYRPHTCVDIFSPTEIQFPKGYNKDSKVVVNVTVQGSPGPIRALVKLGSNVDQTIRLVVKKYNEQGRTPHLHTNAASKSQLHHSSFSLESLSKSDLIADVGSRSFYLRTNININSSDEPQPQVNNNNNIDDTSNEPDPLAASTLSSLQFSLHHNLKKLIRGTRKVVCLAPLFGTHQTQGQEMMVS